MNPHNLRRSVLVGGMALAAALALVVPSGAGSNAPKADTQADSSAPCLKGGPCTGPCGGQGHGPHGMGKGMGTGMGMGGRMGGGPLVTALGNALDQAKLTEAQKSTLEGLRKQADQLRDDGRARFEAAHADFESELAKSEPDLRALSTKMTAAREEVRKGYDAIRDGYLSLYDGLSADQKKGVVTALRSHVEERKQMREQWKGGHHGKGGPDAAGEDG